VKDYVAVESAYRKDPVYGTVYGWQRIGLDPRRMALEVHQAINGPQGGHLAAHVNQQAQVH
jgi:hypothetical protein